MDTVQFEKFCRMIKADKKKLSHFSSGDGLEWITWKKHFELVCDINGWKGEPNANAADLLIADEKMRREAKASMSGLAARMVSDLQHDAAGVDIEQLLTKFESRFLPQAASDLARMMFRQACQLEGETAIQWHTRARELYHRAQPTANLETAQELKDCFVLGLRIREVKQCVWDAKPPTLSECLEKATNKEAGLLVTQGYALGPPTAVETRRRSGINAMNPQFNRGDNKGDNQRGRNKLVCWNCGDPNHFKRDCPKLSAAEKDRMGAPRWKKPQQGWQPPKKRSVNTMGQEDSSSEEEETEN
jgi:hypothetical protein